MEHTINTHRRHLSILPLIALLMVACTGQSAVPSAPAVTPLPSTSVSAAPTPGAATPSTTAPSTGSFDRSVRLTLERVASGFQQATDVASAGDGTGRLFVVERTGQIRIVQNGQTVQQPFLDIQALITSSGQEQGLLGLAFHPQYRQNGRLFVAYSARNNDNTVAEYRVSSDANRVDPNSAKVLLAIPDFAGNHNGGNLVFGPDGFLYIGTGDGGGAGDPQRTAMNLNNLLGKMLRIDVNSGNPYAIPADNPFVNRQDARPEVWAFGLRNPWRYSFDSANGDFWIADVGQNEWEEINRQPAGNKGGQNYGWSTMEGTHCYRPASNCDQTGLTMPVAEYNHSNGCSVTGGGVYRGRQSPKLTGAYIYGDYCSGRVWAMVAGGTPVELMRDESLRPTSFGEDEAGELYVVGIGGQLSKLVGR